MELSGGLGLLSGPYKTIKLWMVCCKGSGSVVQCAQCILFYKWYNYTLWCSVLKVTVANLSLLKPNVALFHHAKTGTSGLYSEEKIGDWELAR